MLPLSHRRFDDTLPLDQCFQALASDDDIADDDWPVLSPQFQATIPALRPRSARPTRSEAKFLQAVQVYPPTRDTADDLLPDVSTDSTACRAQEFHTVYLATIPRDRAQLLADTVQALDAKLGPYLVKVGRPQDVPQGTAASRAISKLPLGSSYDSLLIQHLHVCIRSISGGPAMHQWPSTTALLHT
jgi:hypothetical protein